MAWACRYPLSLCDRQCECRVRVAASVQQPHTHLLCFCAIVGCEHKRSCPNTTVMRRIDLDDHPVFAARRPESASGTFVIWHMRRNLAITRAFCDCHSVLFSPTEAANGKNPSMLMTQSSFFAPTAVEKNIVIEDLRDIERAPVPSLFLRLQLRKTGTPPIASVPAQWTAESDRQERARSEHFATFCHVPESIIQRAQRSGPFSSVGSKTECPAITRLCVCVCFQLHPKQIERRHVLVRPHPFPLCASDGLHVGNDGRNIFQGPWQPMGLIRKPLRTPKSGSLGQSFCTAAPPWKAFHLCSEQKPTSAASLISR